MKKRADKLWWTFDGGKILLNAVSQRLVLSQRRFGGAVMAKMISDKFIRVQISRIPPRGARCCPRTLIISVLFRRTAYWTAVLTVDYLIPGKQDIFKSKFFSCARLCAKSALLALVRRSAGLRLALISLLLINVNRYITNTYKIPETDWTSVGYWGCKQIIYPIDLYFV